MLGSLSEADDAVQEAWLLLSRSDAAAIENLGGWLTTMVARICPNMLQARKSRREEPVGVHVPDPVVSPPDEVGPEQEALLADTVGLALLVVLHTLSPAERLAFGLHDMFGCRPRRSPRSSATRRRRRGSWQAAPRRRVQRRRHPTSTSPCGGSSWTRS